jgi:hypothetical protein
VKLAPIRGVLAVSLFALASCARPQADPASGPTSPAAPSPAPADDFQKLLASLGVGYQPGEKRLELAGTINMQKGLIEVLACAAGGKTHEALIVLDCVPSGVHAGLLALGLKAGTPVETGTEADYRAPAGDPVIVEVAWKTAQGEERRRRAEDLVWNEAKQAAMEHPETVGSPEGRVNLWPFLYHRKPATSFLWPLYLLFDTIDRPAKDGERYRRTRVLWRLWHDEEVGKARSLDVFPFITYDRSGEESLTWSWLYKLVRYERQGEAKALNLFFLPAIRWGR